MSKLKFISIKKKKKSFHIVNAKLWNDKKKKKKLHKAKLVSFGLKSLPRATKTQLHTN